MEKSMNRKYVEELIKLMQENPELEVLCKVDSDIVAEDGHKICIVEVTTEKLAIRASVVTVVSNLG